MRRVGIAFFVQPQRLGAVAPRRGRRGPARPLLGAAVAVRRRAGGSAARRSRRGRARRCSSSAAGSRSPASSPRSAGASVLATDGATDAVAFAAHVLALNEVEGEVAHVDWSTHGDALVERGPFDLVLAADVLYTQGQRRGRARRSSRAWSSRAESCGSPTPTAPAPTISCAILRARDRARQGRLAAHPAVCLEACWAYIKWRGPSVRQRRDYLIPEPAAAALYACAPSAIRPRRPRRLRRSRCSFGLAAALTTFLTARLLPAVAGTTDPRWPHGIVNVYDAVRHDGHDDHRRAALDRSPAPNVQIRVVKYEKDADVIVRSDDKRLLELCGKDCLGYSTAIGRPTQRAQRDHPALEPRRRAAAAVGVGRGARARARARPAPPRGP